MNPAIIQTGGPPPGPNGELCPGNYVYVVLGLDEADEIIWSVDGPPGSNPSVNGQGTDTISFTATFAGSYVIEVCGEQLSYA